MAEGGRGDAYACVRNTRPIVFRDLDRRPIFGCVVVTCVDCGCLRFIKLEVRVPSILTFPKEVMQKGLFRPLLTAPSKQYSSRSYIRLCRRE